MHSPSSMGSRGIRIQHYNCEMMTFRTVSHLRVIADANMPWTLDGEREDGHSQVEITNLHEAIRIIQRKD